MLNIREGKVPRPQKIVIYGAEGIGKTTLASQFPKPLFIDTEGGTSHIDVRRIDKPATWDELLADVNEIADTKGICETLVIDTADWAEQLAINYVCVKYKKAGIEEFGYSKGYTYLAEEFSRLLSELDNVVDSGMHVVVTAHAKMRKFEQPDELGAYDRWEMKLTKQVAPLLKEWCDLLLFCNYKTYVVQSGNAMEKAKVQGGKRVMYASHHPCWDAKNRHGLPDEMPLSFESIASIFKTEESNSNSEPDLASAINEPTKPIDILHEKMKADGVTEEQVRRVVALKKKYSEETPISEYPDNFINNWVIKYWEKILNMIKEES